MLKFLLGNSDFGALLSLVSGDALQAISARESMKIATRVAANARDKRGWAEARQAAGARLARIGVSFTDVEPAGDPGPLRPSDADRILDTYFLQLLAAETWILDFRGRTWRPGPDERTTLWLPSSVYFAPSAEFLAGVRGLYRGFYGDDAEGFRRALHELGLTPAEGILREHFGADGQSAVAFSLPEFQRSFAKVFAACAGAKSRIHPEFAILGVCLVSLYEALSAGGQKLDVRGAFARAERVTGAAWRWRLPALPASSDAR